MVPLQNPYSGSPGWLPVTTSFDYEQLAVRQSRRTHGKQEARGHSSVNCQRASRQDHWLVSAVFRMNLSSTEAFEVTIHCLAGGCALLLKIGRLQNVARRKGPDRM
jgi:hypothetical protein